VTVEEPDRYRLALATSAARRLSVGPPRGLALAAASAIAEFLYGPLLDGPYRLGKPLRGELTGYLSARRGPYRIIYRIDDDKQVVHVVRIDHRSDVYHAGGPM
jgi:mRNA-degrading endonuclease RelE of RelBE toxin-antitoxin system